MLSFADYERLQARLAEHMTQDDYGLHTIISIYFDTPDYEMIRHSIEKPKYKEKFRVRSYGAITNEKPVFLEIKKKFSGVVYKRRMPLLYQEMLSYLQHPHSYQLDTPEYQQIKEEIDWLLIRKKLEPKVKIVYERRAFFGKEDADFRVTFDSNIRYSTTNLTDDSGTLVAPEMDVLMEVKALGAYPMWFSTILAELAIYPGSFSKYAQTYQRYLYSEEDFSYVI